ncbi:FKBP-type peptidyl-prolyl cis-trans isomerase [Candidatus Vallotia cooleyia]|uniref:FKBP-type peptidyl-prolyl cis-trans isomerase n=1 Tax=Candidatus Vallotiella adelgis TaxID=1177211 RepID=UPI001D0185A3|nr:peptidylprolyl isomerase [Candidatus Vallotia cooleyia]UDG82310.1 FKBP-type peptidyl-prolyl cis-trans isomerase SlyD [Candidatus Vallotia cooleyia]
MKITKNTIVSVVYKLSDAQGNWIEEEEKQIIYLHGGYHQTFPKIEEVLEGHETGFSTQIQLEPADAFGDYDSKLLNIERRERFSEPLEVGMQFEGTPAGVHDAVDTIIYTVTDLVEDKVVLDGNPPLAGMALRFSLTVRDVRKATLDEVHAHGGDRLEVISSDDNCPLTMPH